MKASQESCCNFVFLKVLCTIQCFFNNRVLFEKKNSSLKKTNKAAGREKLELNLSPAPTDGVDAKKKGPAW
jgi:hypothetical protein